jgi:thioester reductase-like protein
VNHLETYAMARQANVDSVRELLALGTSGKPKTINYISSLGVFSPLGTEITRVVNEESPIDLEKHPGSRGYSASKWVGEKICMTASEKGIPCNIFRVGLVWADTQQGRYDELQNGYRILKSCLLSGYGIRDFQFEMAPTPVDYVARAVVHLASRHSQGAGIFHISSSKQPIAGVFERCNETRSTSLTLLSFYEWIREIKRLHQGGRSLPAVPLVEFAFSMDKESFHEHIRDARFSRILFDCERTHRELENAGLAAPELDDALLNTCLKDILLRDAEVREFADSTTLSVCQAINSSTVRRCQHVVQF